MSDHMRIGKTVSITDSKGITLNITRWENDRLEISIASPQFTFDADVFLSARDNANLGKLFTWTLAELIADERTNVRFETI